MACRVWHETKINYVFIFEYDTRHFLDWRQLAEVRIHTWLAVSTNDRQLPCWCLFFLGLCMYLNFSLIGGEAMFIYYPVILISISVAILICPIKIFHFRTRMWLLYSLVRCLCEVKVAIVNHAIVALNSRWRLSCRVARLLSRRHVLLFDVHHGRKFLALHFCSSLMFPEHGHILLSILSRLE